MGLAKIVIATMLLGAAALAKPTAPATAPVTRAASTAPADQSTPKAALKTFARALESGDGAGVRELLQADNEQERKLADATVELAEATAQLARAARGAFGDDRSRPLGADPAASTEALARIDAATEKVDGDTATLRTAEDEGPPLVLVKRDGKWRVPVAELSKDVEPADLERNIADMTWQAEQMRNLSAEVSAGKYVTAAEARQMLDRRIMERTLPPLRSTTAPATTQK